MVKKLIIFLLAVILFANLNKDVLLIEAKLYPKIIMLTKNLQNKNKIKISIVVNQNTVSYGEILKKLMQNKRFVIKLINDVTYKSDVYILTFPLSKKIINNLLNKNKIIFSISPNYINMSMFSIYIGARVYPYINPYLIKKANIEVDPIIFKVGKIYE